MTDDLHPDLASIVQAHSNLRKREEPPPELALMSEDQAKTSAALANFRRARRFVEATGGTTQDIILLGYKLAGG